MCLLAATFFPSFAADSTSVKIVLDQKRVSDSEVLLTIKAKVDDGIKLYSLQKSDADVL